MHLRVSHGEKLWCGYGCDFSYPVAASYLYRRHLEAHHERQFKEGLPTGPAPVTSESAAESIAEVSSHPTNEPLTDQNANLVSTPKEVPAAESVAEVSSHPTDEPLTDQNANLVPVPAQMEDSHPSEIIQNLLDELLPPGCLSPLPVTPPRRVESKSETEIIRPSTSDNVQPRTETVQPSLQTPEEPQTPVKRKRAEVNVTSKVASTCQWLDPIPDTLEPIDARFNGQMEYHLTRITLPTSTLQTRGRDPRLEGLLLKRRC